MSAEMFADPSLDPQLRPLQPGRIEPELDPRSEPQLPDSTPTSQTRFLSGTDNEDRAPIVSLSNSAPHRYRSMDRPIGSLLYLFLVGSVAIAIVGTFFGSDFLLLTQPTRETIADSGARDRNPPHSYPNVLQGDRDAPPAAPELAAPNSVAVAALPKTSAAQSAAVPEAAPVKRSEPAQGSLSVPPSGEPPAHTAPELQPAASSAASPAPGTPQATPKPLSVQDNLTSGGAKRRLSADGRWNHIRMASRRSGPRPSRSEHSLTPPQPSQASSFDQLLTHLAGQTEPPTPSLTPPQPGQPDPFDQRAPK